MLVGVEKTLLPTLNIMKSKRDTISLKEVERLAGFGFIDKEIAYILDVGVTTLNKYKHEPEFKSALERGKLVADKKVVKSLYNKAVGFKHDKRYYPPDTTAIIFWLKNRRPDLWRDKHEVEHTGEVKLTKEERAETVNRIKGYYTDQN